MSGRVLDRGAILDMLSSNGSIYARVLLRTAVDTGIEFRTPTTALLDACTQLPAEDQVLLQLFVEAPTVLIEPLDAATAVAAGARAHHTLPAGRYDASVVHTVDLARRSGDPILANDPRAIRAIDPTVPIEELPGP